MRDEQQPFWMVWSPQGSAPTHQHWTDREAIQEAERLARKCPGKKFYVLAAMQMLEVNDIRRVEIDQNWIPF